MELALIAGFVWFVFNPLCGWIEKRSVRAAEFRQAEAYDVERSRGFSK